MGECGCGQEMIELVFPGPDGSKYGIEVYPGCHYCGNGTAVTLYQMGADEEIFHEIAGEAREVEWVDHGYNDLRSSVIPIITPEALVESMQENMGDLLPSRFTTTDLFRTLQDAVWKTSDKR